MDLIDAWKLRALAAENMLLHCGFALTKDGWIPPTALNDSKTTDKVIKDLRRRVAELENGLEESSELAEYRGNRVVDLEKELTTCQTDFEVWKGYVDDADKRIKALEQEIVELRSRPAPVPEGWKLVPINPNANMVRAVLDVQGRSTACVKDVYKGMVSAAPSPPIPCEVAYKPIPEGWQLVPKEMTDDMHLAACNCHDGISAEYVAALAVAPQPPI